MFKRILPQDNWQPKPGESYMTTSHGMSGYFAVQIWVNPNMGGFEEPYNTGFGRYATEYEAYQEAEAMAIAEDIPLIFKEYTYEETLPYIRPSL